MHIKIPIPIPANTLKWFHAPVSKSNQIHLCTSVIVGAELTTFPPITLIECVTALGGIVLIQGSWSQAHIALHPNPPAYFCKVNTFSALQCIEEHCRYCTSGTAFSRPLQIQKYKISKSGKMQKYTNTKWKSTQVQRAVIAFSGVHCPDHCKYKSTKF